MILFGLRGVGSANACLPAIKIIKEKKIPLKVYAESPAYDVLLGLEEMFYIHRMCDVFHYVKPKLAVATCSAVGGAVPIDFVSEAKRRNISVILVEDMWSSHSSFPWPILPDGVCVVDEFAKKLILGSWPGYPESSIHITGAPVFDKFVNIQTGSAKYKLREALELNKDWPIVFMVGEIWGMTQGVSMLVNSLNDLGMSAYLILRDHPTIFTPDAPDEYKRIYAEYREVLKDLKTGVIIDSSRLTSDEVLAGSDVVVGICSTMLEEACYLRKSVINIWTPEIGQILFNKAGNTYEEQPITNLGGSLKAQSVNEIIGHLKKIFKGDIADTLGAQEKHFRTDGLSGRRVAEVILKYYA